MTDATATTGDDQRDERDDRQSPEPPTEPVLSVDGVGHAYGDVPVLSDVSFAVEAGTVAALVGPNGSGKTTLLRAVLGLLAPDSGSVSLPPAGASGRRVGYLPQQPAFRPVFTAGETLQFYADLLDADADVAETIDRVGLSEARDRRVDALSGGMTRLLGVGQAVLGDPPLVVLDEPTGDLDPRMTEYVFEVVADLADAGTAVLLATHNLSGAADADTVLALDRGDLVAAGSPDEFVARADADSFREAFLATTGLDASDAVEPGSGRPSVGVRGGDSR